MNEVIAPGAENTDVIIERPNYCLFYRVIKRAFDVTASLIGLVLLLPLFMVVAVAIRLESAGSAIFVQERSGVDGKPFRMYKFRSMCKDAPAYRAAMEPLNELDGPAFKLKNDPRVTRVGAFIRKTSMDELPQLWNVLKGDMSLVGPRPLPIYETEKCTPYQLQRLYVKPGITCYWQIFGRNDICFDEWVALDLKYIQEASPLTDLKILLLTVKVVISGKGAY